MLLPMGAPHLPPFTASICCLLLVVLLSLSAPSLPLPVTSSPYTNAFSFSFPAFDAQSPLALYGNARIDAAGAVQMSSTQLRTNPTSDATTGALLMYARPLDFGRKPNFSAAFDFSISNQTGNGLAFFVAPAGMVTPADLAAGVPPGVFAVEFDTAKDPDARDANDNHVGVDVGSAVSLRAFNVSTIGLVLGGGEKLRTWIDFDGDKGVLEVRLNRSSSSSSFSTSSRPALPFASCRVDLAGIIWQEAMLVGISTTGSTAGTSSSSPATQVVTIYSWTFSLTHAAPYRMHSEPLDPGLQPFDAAASQSKQIPLVVVQQGPANGGAYFTTNILMALALGAACGAAIALLVVLLCSAKVERHPVAPVAEYHSSKPSEFGYEKIVVLSDLGGKDVDDAGSKDRKNSSSGTKQPSG